MEGAAHSGWYLMCRGGVERRLGCCYAAPLTLPLGTALSSIFKKLKRERERKPAGMHCTTYQRYTNTIGWLGRSKRNHREVTYSIVQNVGKVTVAVLVDEGGERKSVRLDAAVERVVARVDAADATPPFEEGLTGRRAYALDVVRKRVRLRSAAPVEPYVEG